MTIFERLDKACGFESWAAGSRQRISRRRVLKLAVCAFLACVLSGCDSDRKESFYSSLADAKRDGAIDRAWIPEYLPESSRNIHELHGLSPSVQWCAFDFLTSDTEVLRRALGPDVAAIRSVKRIPKPGKAWWPPVLIGDLDINKIHQAGFSIYELNQAETVSTREWLIFAIDWVKGRGFFYRVPASAS